ncbi:MAG TPA: hypothetical protein VJ781_02585 [Pyrinomonadaceae bacterium]|nr:hypothetical protein [Pyrinomonadaceae bacterium]
MRNKAIFLISALLISVFSISAQTEIKASLVPGDVVSVSEKQIVIKTKDGQLNVELSAKTEFKRVAAERPSIASAVPAALSEIVVGDKVIASGVFGDDRSKLPARTIYLMSKSDIAQKNAKEAEKWTRGISGKVASVNSQTGQISVEVRNLMGTSTIVVTPKDGAVFKRYAPNSVRYSEAVVSSLGAIQAGDMLRAAGDKSADGLSFSADEVVTGAFQTIAGTVKSIDTEKNEVVITNLQTNKDVTVALATASVMKKFPEEFAQRMVQAQGAGGPGGAPRPGTQPAQATPPAGAPGQPGGPVRMFPGGARGGGIDEMLERFPTITAADLKAGDMIAVSSTKSSALDKISAIKLLAGVEPFVRAAQAAGNLQRGRGGQDSFNIPGLDGFDFP